MSMNNVNIPVIEWDIQTAIDFFGRNRISWDHEYNWVKIDKFPLPPSCNMKSSDILIGVPSGFGFGAKYYEEAYLDSKLKVRNSSGKFVHLPHFFQKNVHTDTSYQNLGWGWICIKTKTKSLLSFMRALEQFLMFPLEEKMV